MDRIKLASELIKFAKILIGGSELGPGVPDGTGPCSGTEECPIDDISPRRGPQDGTGPRSGTPACPVANDGNYLRVEYGDDNLMVTLEKEDDGRFEVTVSKKYENQEWKEMEEYYFDLEEEAQEKFDKVVESF